MVPYHAPGQSRARERGSFLRCAMFCSRRTRRPSAEVCSCIRPGADKEEGSRGRKDNKLEVSKRAGGGKHRRVRARETQRIRTDGMRTAFGGIILGPSLAQFWVHHWTKHWTKLTLCSKSSYTTETIH